LTLINQALRGIEEARPVEPTSALGLRRPSLRKPAQQDWRQAVLKPLPRLRNSTCVKGKLRATSSRGLSHINPVGGMAA
jgi:hypothetical protein